MVRGPGVVIGRKGTLGSVFFAPTDYWPHDTTLWVKDFHGNDPKWAYYFLKTLGLEKYDCGASNPSLNRNHIHALTVSYPPRLIQRRIASILSAYDDLIENNTRRIQILERMAQALYREWFVQFRFPGHAKVKRVASPLGPIPQGWRVARLEELTTYLNRGLAPSYAEDGGLVINQKCIRNGRLNLDLARHQSKTVPEDKLVRVGDVLINSTGEGTLGRVAQVCENIESCTVDTHVTIVRPRPEIDPDFFGLSLIPKEDRFMKMGVGSTGQTEFSRQAIGDVQIVVPPSHERTTFGAVVRPIRQLVLTLERRNANLRRTRDLLLPKLISGALDVSKLDLETGSERGIHSAAPREGSTPAE
jgi:type I restriction enzyme S subunit